MDKKPVFALRLKQARLRAGLSVADICRELGFTRQSYSYYENGTSRPSAERLLKIQNFLHVTSEDLTRESKASIAGLNFRKNYKFNKHEQEIVAERIRDAIEKRFEVESDLGIEARPCLPAMKHAANAADACDAARKARREWRLGSVPIMNMQRLLEEKGILVVPVEAGYGFDGVSGTEDSTGRPFVAINISKGNSERRRLTAAHELGHLCLDASGDAEPLCNSFANEFLLPSEALLSVVESGKPLLVSVLKDLQRTYGISIRAIIVKLHAVGVIDDDRYKRIWIELNQNKALKDRLDRSEFSEPTAGAFEKLVLRAVKEKAYSPSYAAGLLGISEEDLVAKAKEPKYV